MLELRLPPDYVLYKMNEYELSAIIDNADYANRQHWEQCRQIVYTLAQINSRRRLKPTDILQFSWDKEKAEESTSNAPTKADYERLLNRAKQLEDVNYN